MRRIGRVFAAALALAMLAATPGMAASGTTVGARHSGLRSSASPRLSVLAYHAIADLDGDPILGRYSVPPGRFAEQLDFLLARGWNFVDLDTALAVFNGDRRLPPRAVLLTFDDAYTDLLDIASPILVERGIPRLPSRLPDRSAAPTSGTARMGRPALSCSRRTGCRRSRRAASRSGRTRRATGPSPRCQQPI